MVGVTAQPIRDLIFLVTEYSTILTLADPSICSSTSDAPQSIFMMTCFYKDHNEAMHVEVGDVVILRHIKVRQSNLCQIIQTWTLQLLFYKNCRGVGYHDTLRYSTYQSTMAKRYPKSINPQQQYDPQQDEVNYCRNMICWWKTIQTVSTNLSSKHISITEAVIGKYFDCTVEVSLSPTTTKTTEPTLMV